MGVILDTGILIARERAALGVKLGRWPAGQDDAFISAITVSELLVGVHRAKSARLRTRRSAFVEALLARLPALDFTAEIARVHAEVHAALAGKGKPIGAHDLMIAATALWHGHAVVTTNRREFERVPGLEVVA